jgi:single-strand DNA-binding protein
VTGRFRLREWETEAKKGVSAEIDADALGHDLLWGTSVFERRTASGPGTERTPAAQAALDEPGESGSEPVDSWTAPGAARELVGSGDTPF